MGGAAALTRLEAQLSVLKLRVMAVSDGVPCRGMHHPGSLVRGPPWGRPWAQGGRTDLNDGVLLRNWHHHHAHDPTYASSRMPNGDVRFSRRT